MGKARTYLCIDLKSFYASVECAERGLDPLTTNLVVADPDRTEKTICLAVSPSLKALGIPNRCRVFQIPKGIDYIMATPRMQLYIDYSAEIYAIYLKYIAKEDIYVYSIDEAFMDVTDYLIMYQMTARELGTTIMNDVLCTLGVTAACGIGTNMYLAKVALDIAAKHAEDHVAMLDEESFCRQMWDYRPLTDFWRIGSGTAGTLEKYGILTMRDITRADENLLYRLFGIDAELLIDHAWGRETTTIADIKAYKPKNSSLTSGQVLPCDYKYDKAKIVIKEMAEQLCLDLVDKGLITGNIALYVGYSNRLQIEAARGSVTLTSPTASRKTLITQVMALFEKNVDRTTPIRRMNLSFNRVMDETYEQYDLFTDPAELEKERKAQQAMLDIKKKFGKNAIVKGLDLVEGATTMERNRQIGGHRSGVSD